MGFWASFGSLILKKCPVSAQIRGEVTISHFFRDVSNMFSIWRLKDSCLRVETTRNTKVTNIRGSVENFVKTFYVDLEDKGDIFYNILSRPFCNFIYVCLTR